MRSTQWQQWTVRERLAVVRRVRGFIAARGMELAESVPRDPAETLVAEVLPLAEACRFLERSAEALLAPRRLRRGRPIWLAGTSLEVRREPLGKVLVIGPSNYPLLLPAVHTLQALVAGNAVLLKPGRGAREPLQMFAGLLQDAGLPSGTLTLLSEDPRDAEEAIEAGVDKVILTGSNATGQAVLKALSAHVTPSVMELSGCDSVFVLEDADLDLVADAVRFGLTLNNGNTCIAPKRIYVSRYRAAALAAVEPKLRIPIVAVDSTDEAVALSEQYGYGLGASVFGGVAAATQLARRLKTGVVVVNDMIVPTADPRLPFGGRGKSGFGVTRGAEGLLEMTAIKAICVRSGKWRPHFEQRRPSDWAMFAGVLAALHANSWKRRFDGILQLSRAAMARGKAV
jgi:aldehyde dehydrogenase (NAD+)